MIVAQRRWNNAGAARLGGATPWPAPLFASRAILELGSDSSHTKVSMFVPCGQRPDFGTQLFAVLQFSVPRIRLSRNLLSYWQNARVRQQLSLAVPNLNRLERHRRCYHGPTLDGGPDSVIICAWSVGTCS